MGDTRTPSGEGASRADFVSSPIFELLSLPSWVFEIDTQRVIAVNAAACEFYGYTRDEFLALQLKDLRPPAEEQKLVEDIARVRSAGVLRGQWLHKNKAGEVIEVEVMGRPLTLDGVPCRWVTVLDRRETARLTEAKEQAEQLVRLVLDNAGMIVFVIDDKGIMRLNEGEALRAMGLAPGYLVGEQVLDHRMGLQFRTPLGLVDGAEVTRRVMAGEVFTGLLEHNGRVVENVIAPLRGQDGKVRGQTGFARDVTNQVRQSERLMQAHKLEAIGRLAGGIAHDFNNMLTIIASATENLMDRIPEGTDERVELQDIHDATVRSSLLTRQLLAFSRRQPIVPRLVDINMLLGDAGRMLERLVGEDVQLEIKLSRSPVHVYGDPGQLEQILFNLAANARDAMPAGGRLSMETELVELDHTALVGRPGAKPGRYCLLAVRDTGVGMDAETMERAFEPFFTTKDPGQGTGLGLATVYGVVQQSKGQVWLYSEVGKGTTVKVYLPEAPLAQSLAPAPRPAQQDYSGTETVLLVEDDRVIRRMANAALGRFGYRVLVASNGEEGLAMALAHEGDIDLLVTDVVMPGMSGHALFARLHPLRPRLKVLYVSGYTEDVLRERGGLDANAQVLEKPFTHLTLGKHIREILDRK